MAGTGPDNYGYLTEEPLPNLCDQDTEDTLYKVLDNPFGASQMADIEFKKEILSEYRAYENDVLYFPAPQLDVSQFVGNSNSFIGSIVRGVGISDSGPWNAPGWSVNVILP